jgi:hypothetical protein
MAVIANRQRAEVALNFQSFQEINHGGGGDSDNRHRIFILEDRQPVVKVGKREEKKPVIGHFAN